MIALLLRVWKTVLSPVVHAINGGPLACRFQPTCSEYAALAVHVHGPVRGTALAAWRLLRCHPLARGGFDPVPESRHRTRPNRQPTPP